MQFIIDNIITSVPGNKLRTCACHPSSPRSLKHTKKKWFLYKRVVVRTGAKQFDVHPREGVRGTTLLGEGLSMGRQH